MGPLRLCTVTIQIQNSLQETTVERGREEGRKRGREEGKNGDGGMGGVIEVEMEREGERRERCTCYTERGG